MPTERKLLFYNKGDFLKALTDLRRCGGPKQKAAEQVSKIVGEITIAGSTLSKLTNHGESRIPHCVKYDLQGDCRLVTVQNEGAIWLLFVGDHDDTDRWLNTNSGLIIASGSKKQIRPTIISAPGTTIPLSYGFVPTSDPRPLLARLMLQDFEALVPQSKLRRGDPRGQALLFAVAGAESEKQGRTEFSPAVGSWLISMVSLATSKPASAGHFKTSHPKGGFFIGLGRRSSRGKVDPRLFSGRRPEAGDGHSRWGQAVWALPRTEAKKLAAGSAQTAVGVAAAVGFTGRGWWRRPVGRRGRRPSAGSCCRGWRCGGRDAGTGRGWRRRSARPVRACPSPRWAGYWS